MTEDEIRADEEIDVDIFDGPPDVDRPQTEADGAQDDDSEPEDEFDESADAEVAEEENA